MERLFNAEEQAAILHRAAEMQNANGGATLADIERAASEAGLDPAYVRLAVNEMAGLPSHPRVASRLVGRDLITIIALFVAFHLAFMASVASWVQLEREFAVPAILLAAVLGILAARSAIAARGCIAAMLGVNLAGFLFSLPVTKVVTDRFLYGWDNRHMALAMFKWEATAFVVTFALAHFVLWLIRAHRPRAMG